MEENKEIFYRKEVILMGEIVIISVPDGESIICE